MKNEEHNYGETTNRIIEKVKIETSNRGEKVKIILDNMEVMAQNNDLLIDCNRKLMAIVEYLMAEINHMRINQKKKESIIEKAASLGYTE